MLISCYSNQDVENRIIEMEENNGITLPEQYRKGAKVVYGIGKAI